MSIERATNQLKDSAKQVFINAPKEGARSASDPLGKAVNVGTSMLTRAIGESVKMTSKTGQYVFGKVAGFLGRNALEVAKIPPNLLLALPIVPVPGSDKKTTLRESVVNKADPRKINDALSRPGGLDELLGKKPEEPKKDEEKKPS